MEVITKEGCLHCTLIWGPVFIPAFILIDDFSV